MKHPLPHPLCCLSPWITTNYIFRPCRAKADSAGLGSGTCRAAISRQLCCRPSSLAPCRAIRVRHSSPASAEPPPLGTLLKPRFWHQQDFRFASGAADRAASGGAVRGATSLLLHGEAAMWGNLPAILLGRALRCRVCAWESRKRSPGRRSGSFGSLKTSPLGMSHRDPGKRSAQS